MLPDQHCGPVPLPARRVPDECGPQRVPPDQVPRGVVDAAAVRPPAGRAAGARWAGCASETRPVAGGDWPASRNRCLRSSSDSRSAGPVRRGPVRRARSPCPVPGGRCSPPTGRSAAPAPRAAGLGPGGTRPAGSPASAGAIRSRQRCRAVPSSPCRVICPVSMGYACGARPEGTAWHRAAASPGSAAPRAHSRGTVTRRSASMRATAASSCGSRSRRTDSSRVPAGMDRDVDRGDDGSGAVAHRCGDGAQALLQFLVDDGVSLPSDAVEFGAQQIGRDDGPGGQGARPARVRRSSISWSGRWAIITRPTEVRGRGSGSRP